MAVSAQDVLDGGPVEFEGWAVLLRRAEGRSNPPEKDVYRDLARLMLQASDRGHSSHQNAIATVRNPRHAGNIAQWITAAEQVVNGRPPSSSGGGSSTEPYRGAPSPQDFIEIARQQVGGRYGAPREDMIRWLEDQRDILRRSRPEFVANITEAIRILNRNLGR